jgi:uncharacterized protein (DUF2384 family)
MAATINQQLNPTASYERSIREALALPGLSPERSMRVKRYIRIVAGRTGESTGAVIERLGG